MFATYIPPGRVVTPKEPEKPVVKDVSRRPKKKKVAFSTGPMKDHPKPLAWHISRASSRLCPRVRVQKKWRVEAAQAFSLHVQGKGSRKYLKRQRAKERVRPVVKRKTRKVKPFKSSRHDKERPIPADQLDLFELKR